MGGNACGDSKRMGLESYRELKRKLGAFLEANSLICEHRFPKELGDKVSFGDLDILVMTKCPLKVPLLVSKIQAEFGDVVNSGSVFSVLVNGHQVDFIFVDQAIDFAAQYFSNSDLGNLLGYYAMHKGLKLGHTGLYISRHVPNVGKERQYVTRNWREALDILGFEGVHYPEQFPHAKAMLDFVATSKLFEAKDSVFSLENLSSRHRAAIRKRQYQRLFFCEYLGYPEKSFAPQK